MKKGLALYVVATVLMLVSVCGAPHAAHAASTSFFGPIISPACNCDVPISANGVTAPSSAPGWGCVLDTFQRSISLAVSLAVVFITFLIALAGFSYMTSGGSPEGRSLANQRIVNVALGLLLTLGAYLLVDSLMKVIYNPNNAAFGPWNSILGSSPTTDCLAPSKPPSSLAAMTPSNASGNPAPTTPQQSTVPVTSTGSSGLNINATVAWLTANVQTTQSSHRCLAIIQQALSAGGVSLQCGAPQGHTGYAGYCNSSLAALNFTSLGSSDSSPQPGDILVIQHSTGDMIGHITMWTGSAWVSDFIQPNGESPPGNPYGSAGYNPQYWRP